MYALELGMLLSAYTMTNSNRLNSLRTANDRAAAIERPKNEKFDDYLVNVYWEKLQTFFSVWLQKSFLMTYLETFSLSF